jgi:hypothetical protein
MGWDHPPHSIELATVRAEAVRRRLKQLSQKYRRIAVFTHHWFITFLVQGNQFDNCEVRSFRFAGMEEATSILHRVAVHIETNEVQDYGPTLLQQIEM